MHRLCALALMVVGACTTSHGGVDPVGAALAGAVNPPEAYDFAGVTGRAVVDDPMAPIAVSFERVELRRAGAVVASTTTDAEGRFRFVGDVVDGVYEARLESDRFAAAATIQVDGGRSEPVRLRARPLR